MNKLKVYKNHNIFIYNGLIAVNKVEDKEDNLFFVAEDDSKENGKKFINNKHNNIRTAMKYIDYLTRKK